MSRRFHTHPIVRWRPGNWARMWALRGPGLLDAEVLRRRGEIQAFRLVLAQKEPKA